MKTHMRIVEAIATVLCTLSLLLLGCGQEKKMAPVAVGDMEEYRDPGIGFHIKHPKGWLVNAEVGRARFYNATDVDKKFLDPTGAYPVGVEISINAKKTADAAGEIKRMKDDLAQQVTVKPEQPVTVAGKEATKIPYVANYGGKNILYGHHIMLAADSIVYDLGFSGFGDNYEAYSAIFDASLNSFEPAKLAVKGRDETLPSESMSEYDAKMFTFQYPENFNFTNPPKGTFELALELHGYRQDCSIRFDVFDAKKLSVDKVFEQNKGKYKSKGTGKATIGGENALYLSYAPTPQVESRAYFVVKNDKVVRVTMNWYKPQQDAYLPAFEKVIGSVKFK
jgi:hypothetical protein